VRAERAITLLISLWLMSTAVTAQSPKDCPTPPQYQRVTIEFERFDDARGTLWLRLHNETAWDIRIPVEVNFPGGTPTTEIMKSARSHKDGAEAPVRYYLEEYDPGPWMQTTDAAGHKSPPDELEHPPVPKIRRYDFLTEWWIPKKQSLVFQVPKQHLARNVMLSVSLRYEWEDLGAESLDGPVHIVYLRGIDLPSEVQAKIK
jgi:hypothetical protein